MFASARQFRIGEDKLAEGSIVADVAGAAADMAVQRRKDARLPLRRDFFFWARLSSALGQRHDATMADLILKHAAGTRADDYDVIVDGQVVGYIMLSDAAPADTPWVWTLASDFYENRTLTSGYEATREAAIQAFARSWHREC
jgi:hypothetical protein